MNFFNNFRFYYFRGHGIIFIFTLSQHSKQVSNDLPLTLALAVEKLLLLSFVTSAAFHPLPKSQSAQLQPDEFFNSFDTKLIRLPHKEVFGTNKRT